MNPILDHINKYVSDVELNINFYRDVLGYQLLDSGLKNNGNKYAILMGFNHELFISENKNVSFNNNQYRHIGYSIDNIDILFKNLKNRGYIPENQNIIIKPYSKQFYIKDPDGCEIDIIQWIDKNKFYNDLKFKK